MKKVAKFLVEGIISTALGLVAMNALNYFASQVKERESGKEET
jgi:hypothetical protein